MIEKEPSYLVSHDPHKPPVDLAVALANAVDKLNDVIDEIHEIQRFLNREHPRQPPFPHVPNGS